MSKISSIIIPTILIFLWEITVRGDLFPPSLSASPSQILIKLFDLLISGVIIKHTIYSLKRLIIGVSLGTLAGVLSGLIIGQSQKADKLFSPMMRFMSPVPVVFWIPFAVMFFGTGEYFKTALAAIVAFFIIHIHTYQAIRSVEMDYIELSSIYEKSYFEKVWHIFLPSALPEILTGSRIVFALGWVVIFFVEYGTAKQGIEGLGWFVQDARAVGKVEDQFAGVILLALMGFLVDKAIVEIQKRKLKWSDTIDMSMTQGRI